LKGSQKSIALVLGIVAVVIVALITAGLHPFTFLGVSQIYVEQTGGPVGTNPTYWTNSFWVVTGLADMVESYLMFNSQISNMSGQDYVGGNHLIPTGAIKVTIKPQAPYWLLPLTAESWMVYPKTYGYGQNGLGQEWRMSDEIPAFNVPVWTFRPSASGSWQLHTPFEVVVEKTTGSNTFTRSSGIIDVVGGTGTIEIVNPNDSSEKLKVLDLGKLTTGLTQPSYDYIVAYDPNHALLWDNSVEKDTKYDTNMATGAKLNDYSFSQYWFGGGNIYKRDYATYTVYGGRWVDDKSPKHGDYSASFEDGDFSGYYRADPNSWTSQSIPIAASEFNDITNNPNVKPSPGLSLFNYLKASTVYTGATGTISKTAHQAVNLDAFGQGATIDTTTNQLKVMATYGSAKSLYQLRISTELVDTIVYQEPNVACEFVDAVWEQGGGKSLQIQDTAVAKYVVRNLGTVEASIQVKLLYPGAPVQILPADLITKPVLPNQDATYEFLVKNANTGTQEFAGSLTAQAISAGEVKDTDTSLSYTLPTRQGQETILSLRFVEKGTTTGIGNLKVLVSWTGPAMNDYTDANGAVSFAFSQVVSGNVVVSTEETDIWKPSVRTLSLAGGLNSYTLELERKGVAYGDWLPWIVAGAVVIASVSVIVYQRKRKTRMPERKRR